MPPMARITKEVADGVHVLNYRYLNQNIGVIVGRDEVAVIDTRSSGGQAREILEDVRRLTHLPVTFGIGGITPTFDLVQAMLERID